MTRIARRVFTLLVLAILGVIATATMSVSSASAATYPGRDNSCCANLAANYANREIGQNCPRPPAFAAPPVHKPTKVPTYIPTPAKSSTALNTGGHSGDGGGHLIAPTSPSRTFAHPTETLTPRTPPRVTPDTPRTSRSQHVVHPATVATTPTPAPPAVAAAVPTLNTAPESDALSLGSSPSATPTPTVTSTRASQQPAGIGPSGVQTRTYNEAGNRVSTLGLSDNLLLGALVAVFALAVLGLVTAGGHRGSWRHH
jgi:hypothetical protein